MEIIKTSIEGLLLIQPKVFGDDRGYFFESWSEESFAKNGLDLDFVQDNQSLSSKGVLRGLHFQNPPFSQGKLVRVIKGAVLDVVVDIRKESATYGQHFSIELNEENKTICWIHQDLLMDLLHLRMIQFLLINVQEFIIQLLKRHYYGVIKI